ncbi:MAG: hypothetical protein IT291_05050 [Deltaproteobacteria bacterium]|nr:hypothetical protein [Deltaproteobacteria bacterium]
MKKIIGAILLALICCAQIALADSNFSGIGKLVFVIKRESEKVAVVDLETLAVIKQIPLSGNLRHASMVFDPALTYAYVATRNGRLARIHLPTLENHGSLKTSNNSIGLAISQDGKTVAVADYQPGGITLVDTKTFKVIKRIPAEVEVKHQKILSRVTGLVDGPNNTFICGLMDANEIWLLAQNKKGIYEIKKRYAAATMNPFDGFVTPEGRYYVAGHFNSDKISLIDFWEESEKAKSIVVDPHKSPNLPPVKMPHMEAWAVADNQIFVPRAGTNKISILTGDDFHFAGEINLLGDPVYAVVHPNHRQLWVTFSGDEVDGKIQVIDTKTKQTISVIDAGKRIYHLVFTPRGDQALVSSNETNELLAIDANTLKIIKRTRIKSPSGIFGVWRAFQIGL